MASNPATNVAQMPATGRNVVTIASGKGGVGKTWFAITLAHTLARAGRKVLLFDGDLGLANVDIQLGLLPERDLGSVITGKRTLEQCVTPVEETGFSVLAGRSGSGSLALLPPQRLTALRDQLLEMSGSYDHVLVDLGAGVDRTVQALTPSMGVALVVVTDEPTSLTDAYAFIKLTIADRPKADIRMDSSSICRYSATISTPWQWPRSSPICGKRSASRSTGSRWRAKHSERWRTPCKRQDLSG